MTNHRDFALYLLSLMITLLVFLFCGVFLVVSAAGVKDTEQILSVSTPDPLHMRIEALGGSLELDYTPLAESERVRRDYAPLLTPRPLLTAEYAADYAAYWGAQWYGALEEYFFAKEAYGAGAAQAAAQSDAEAESR